MIENFSRDTQGFPEKEPSLLWLVIEVPVMFIFVLAIMLLPLLLIWATERLGIVAP